MTFRQLRNGRFSPNLVMIRESRSQRRFWTESYENFPFNGPLKPQTWRGSNRHPHSEQATGQEMHCREIFLFIPRCSPRAREFPRWSTCFVRRTVAELRGVKIAQFSDFGLFSPYKTPKKVPSGDQPTAQRLHRRMIPIFPCDSRRSKGVPSGSRVLIRLLVWGWGPQTCPNIRQWQMAIPIQNATTRRIRSGPKMFENAQF